MLFVVLLVIPAAFGIEPACNIIQDLAPNRDLMDPGGSSFDITKFKNNKPKTNELLRIAFYIDERNPWISFGVYKYSVKRYDEEWELLEQRFDVARTCDFAIQKDHGLRRQIEVELVVNKGKLCKFQKMYSLILFFCRWSFFNDCL